MVSARGPALAAGAAAVAAVLALFVAAAAGAASALGPGATLGASPGASRVSTNAAADVPAPMLDLYRRAAASCPGLDWAVLAAVGKVETDHGRSPLPGVASSQNQAGAAGPMQFLAPTFADVVAAHPPPPGGASPPSRYNPHDAVFAAAAYLCDSGARATPTRPGDLRRALLAYNNSGDYVTAVLAQADRYRAPTPPEAASRPGGGSGAAAAAYARGQLGLPYLWGGDGPQAGDDGFDCSGLTTAAWASVGVTIPRTADTQYRALSAVPVEQARAGDLFFFGTTAHVHHVGIATGHGTSMIHAPHRGSTVRVTDAHSLPDLLSAARPA